MKINYIKSNFVTSPPCSDFIKTFFVINNNVRIGKFDQFKKLTVTLMRKDFTFVNVTGAKNLSTVKLFHDFYTKLSDTSIISDLKIDSICATHKFFKTSSISFKDFRKKLNILNLTVKDNSKFPGVVIRNVDSRKGGCAVYFRSGSVNFIGFKHIHFIQQIKQKIQQSLYPKDGDML